MVILYGHPESGHTYKVALTLALAGIPFEYRWVDVFKPRLGGENAARLALPNLRQCLRFEESPTPPAWLDWLPERLQLDLPRLEQELSASQWLLAWMARMRALPRWRHPRELLGKPPH